MNPLTDSLSSCAKNSNIFVADQLLLIAKFKGYKASIISGISDKSFFLDYQKSRGGVVSKIQTIESIRGALSHKGAKKKQHIIELTIFNKPSAFVSFEIQKQDVRVNFLSVPKNQQRNGLGKLLINLVISIAKTEKKQFVTLLSTSDKVNFYKHTFAMKRRLGSSFYNFMELKVTPMKIMSTVKSDRIIFSNAQPEYQISPIPYKKLT